MSSVEFVRATRARCEHSLWSEKRDSKVINRVACPDVLSGGARMLDALAWAAGSAVWVLDAIEGCQ